MSKYIVPTINVRRNNALPIKFYFYILTLQCFFPRGFLLVILGCSLSILVCFVRIASSLYSYLLQFVNLVRLFLVDLVIFSLQFQSFLRLIKTFTATVVKHITKLFQFCNVQKSLCSLKITHVTGAQFINVQVRGRSYAFSHL